MPSLKATFRGIGAVTVVDLSGSVILGESSALLRKAIRDLLESDHTKIILNLGDVSFIDSAGIGELVAAYTSVKSKSGEVKLLNSTKKVHALLKLSRLLTVFEVYSDESSALQSFV
jgi:anti-sigma B factor antagonist